MHLETAKMSDEELDEAITNHLKKLDALQIVSEYMIEKSDNPTNSPGDWCDNENQCLNSKYKNLLNITKSNQQKSICYSNDKCQEDNVDLKKTNLLIKSRNYLADYQEIHHGTPKNEYTFSSLVKLMSQITGKSILVLLYIVANATLVGEFGIFLLRFILDKLVNIQKTNDHHQIAIKFAIFSLELIGIYMCLYFIFGYIWNPIIEMVVEIIFQVLF
ncbi:uncharacterized protein LOC122859259 [Aphidius gifuensis]|uniref:uncharacterized protein LOC122859259 n=1 Tax=Aphidius gifuensis TaxID=684658 RepID=UPI001CDD11E6|nr:uncharacterized protein LOC122859259 [Aphidius gifuensis]